MPEINGGSVLIGSMVLADEPDKNLLMNSNSYLVCIEVIHDVMREDSYF
jgi:hypothetical protein